MKRSIAGLGAVVLIGLTLVMPAAPALASTAHDPLVARIVGPHDESTVQGHWFKPLRVRVTLDGRPLVHASVFWETPGWLGSFGGNWSGGGNGLYASAYTNKDGIATSPPLQNGGWALGTGTVKAVPPSLYASAGSIKTWPSPRALTWQLTVHHPVTWRPPCGNTWGATISCPIIRAQLWPKGNHRSGQGRVVEESPATVQVQTTIGGDNPAAFEMLANWDGSLVHWQVCSVQPPECRTSPAYGPSSQTTTWKTSLFVPMIGTSPHQVPGAFRVRVVLWAGPPNVHRRIVVGPKTISAPVELDIPVAAALSPAPATLSSPPSTTIPAAPPVTTTITTVSPPPIAAPAVTTTNPPPPTTTTPPRVCDTCLATPVLVATPTTTTPPPTTTTTAPFVGPGGIIPQLGCGDGACPGGIIPPVVPS